VTLFLLLRFRAKWITPATIVCAAAVSLYLNEVFGDGFTRFFGNTFADGPSTIFYLAPFRVFEFGIGAILVWLIQYQPRNNQWLEPCVPIGLAIIAYCLFTYSESTLFPSYNALLPCLGAALIIYGGTSRFSSKALDNAPMVWFGLVSCSLYLAHWPIVVFYKYYKFENLDLIDKYAICLLSIAAAALMHRYIEKPFRYGTIGGQALGGRAYASICVMLAALITVPSVAAWLNSGWAWRFPAQVAEQVSVPQSYRNYTSIHSKKLSHDFADDGRQKILIIGDSQATDFINLLYEAKLGDAFDLRFHSIHKDCQPIYGIALSQFINDIAETARNVCAKQIRRLNADNRVLTADTVIFASAWKSWGALLMPRIARSLKKADIGKVIVVGPKTQRWGGPHLLMREYTRDKNDTQKFSFNELSEENLKISQFLKINDENYEFIDLYSIICNNITGCEYITSTGTILFYDDMHLTPDGTRFLSARLAEKGLFRYLTDPSRKSSGTARAKQ